mmetsp:Transcript_175031/g.561301  ORF Transcript_175031/g.561301 Transcript_175031/m.561301 type:complete len:273 (+) Transcript_175031:845-1663(+)
MEASRSASISLSSHAFLSSSSCLACKPPAVFSVKSTAAPSPASVSAPAAKRRSLGDALPLQALAALLLFMLASERASSKTSRCLSNSSLCSLNAAASLSLLSASARSASLRLSSYSFSNSSLLLAKSSINAEASVVMGTLSLAPMAWGSSAAAEASAAGAEEDKAGAEPSTNHSAELCAAKASSSRALAGGGSDGDMCGASSGTGTRILTSGLSLTAFAAETCISTCAPGFNPLTLTCVSKPAAGTRKSATGHSSSSSPSEPERKTKLATTW